MTVLMPLIVGPDNRRAVHPNAIDFAIIYSACATEQKKGLPFSSGDYCLTVNFDV